MIQKTVFSVQSMSSSKVSCLAHLGYPDHFISECGVVYTKKRRGTSKLGELKKMKSVISKRNGREAILLTHNKAFKNFSVHRLVAISFIENPENKPQVNHIDGNPLNNHVSNLEWNTAKENTQHAFRCGLINRSGAYNSQAKLDDMKVLTIKTLVLNGSRNNELSKAFGVKPNTISQIRTGHIWSHVKCGDLTEKVS